MLIEMSVKQVVKEHLSARYYMVLHAHDDDKKRYIAISVGQSEAEAVDAWIKDVVPPRPMTYDLITSMLLLTEHITLLKIIIDSCDDNDVFYAKMIISVNGEERVIDCRPSDAIAVAVRLNVPIFADFCVLDKHGFCCEKEIK